jgi:cob(I)alamin adenosyltransferase
MLTYLEERKLLLTFTANNNNNMNQELNQTQLDLIKTQNEYIEMLKQMINIKQEHIETLEQSLDIQDIQMAQLKAMIGDLKQILKTSIQAI